MIWIRRLLQIIFGLLCCSFIFYMFKAPNQDYASDIIILALFVLIILVIGPWWPGSKNASKLKMDSMNNTDQHQKLSAQERGALKFFFWFSLAFTLLLLMAHPSKETVSLVVVVIYFAFKLFLKKPDSPPVSDITTTSETTMTNATHWSKITVVQWLFIVFCTFATPYYFHARTLNAAYFIMCWLGLALGVISIITFKIFKDGQQSKKDENK